MKARDVLDGHGLHARVLIVDSDRDSARRIKRYFKDQGIGVDHAITARQALAWHRRKNYKLIVAGWAPPEVDGIELCRQLRQIQTDYVYFVLCRAESDPAEIREAYEAGIDDLLAKPLEVGVLYQRLKVAHRILQTESNLHMQRLELEHSGETLRAMNQSLMHASRRFEELFDGLPIACFTMDSRGLIHEWNRQAEREFGIPTHLAFQRPVWDVLGNVSGQFWDQSLVDGVVSGEVREDLDWSMHLPDGSERFFVCNLFGLRDPYGNLVGAISANLDITERKIAERQIDEQILTINQYAKQLQQQKTQLIRANRSLAQLAVTDCMTGLANHRGFQEELTRAYDRHERYRTPLSLILIDIDHFKKFNDAFGHQAGDDLLHDFGGLLRDTTRKCEPASRYGGEEFAIILEGADAESAIEAAQRFRQAIHAYSWPYRAITASFGVATLADGDADRQDLIRRADMALYASKNRGRDCITHYREIDHVHIAA